MDTADQNEDADVENGHVSSSSASVSDDSTDGETGWVTTSQTSDHSADQDQDSDHNDRVSSRNIINETNMEVDSDENFDTNLPASHSYLPGNLITVQGRTVMEVGWEGKVPCWRHTNIIFPGESLPMMCTRPQECIAMRDVIQSDKLFGLLFPNAAETKPSYGVLCEVYEASKPFVNIASYASLSFKAKARQRFRLINKVTWPRSPPEISHRLTYYDIRILPDIVLNDPLLQAGPRSLDKLRNIDNYKSEDYIRRVDAAFTTWPLCVYDTFNVHKMTTLIKEHFVRLGFDLLPVDVVSFSFWVASNLALTTSEKYRLFRVDNAVLRLYIELQHIMKFQEQPILCCASCMAEITNRQDILAMSSEGLRSNYCNPGGYVHDTLTVSKVTNVTLDGLPSEEFSWFPGYKWTIAQCRSCGSHLGWKFDAVKKNLRPSSFWGLSQHYLSPKNSTVYANDSQSDTNDSQSDTNDSQSDVNVTL